MGAEFAVGESAGQQPKGVQGRELGLDAFVGEAQAGDSGPGEGGDWGGDGGDRGGSRGGVVGARGRVRSGGQDLAAGAWQRLEALSDPRSP